MLFWDKHWENSRNYKRCLEFPKIWIKSDESPQSNFRKFYRNKHNVSFYLDCDPSNIHTLPPPTVTAVQDTDEINDIAYARYIKFLQPAPEFKSKLPPPTADIEPALYLVGKEPYNPQQAPFSYDEFD